jgi:hypothetical protein
VTAKPAQSWGYAGIWPGVLVLAVVAVTACEGTKHAIFEPLTKASVGGPTKPATPDAGRAPPVDAGHGIQPHRQHPDAMDDDAGASSDPDLDPNVTFVWTESLPGQGTCRAGVYAGSLDCQFPNPLGGLPFPLSGQIAFTLDGSTEEQHLSITEGSISGALFMSGMTGELDCIANHFQAAAVDGQSVTIGDQTNPFALAFPTFNASLQGEYDNQALVIAGKFAMVNEAGDMCSGTFRVSAAP